ncbi:MAG: CBS domain-containing protein, partial [Roseibium sp.]|uniref:magnesium transporter n=1 Tax=Roseibium sp. TaxID=1936156 RepID=UPI002630EE3A
MSEAAKLDVTASAEPVIPVRDEEDRLNPEFISAVEAAIQAQDQYGLRTLAGDLHEADTGDLLETLTAEERADFIRLLGDEFDYTALTETDEAVRLQVLEDLPNEVIAEGLEDLDSDDAVYILEDLDEDDQAAILEELPYADRAQLQKALDYPEESAGRRMQSEFIAVAPFWTVGQTIDYMREARDLPDSFYEIYVVDPTFKLLGSVHLDKILRTKRAEKVTSIMEETRQAVLATEDQEEVARRFERYNLVSSAVVDENERLVGVLTVDDIVDVIQEEAEEDLRALAGVGDEEISDSVVTIARSRLSWL